MVTVKLENLSKYFGEVKAVDHINLALEEGEFCVLLGPSGCGKTTTMLAVAGIYKPTSGRILFDGKVINDLAPKDRNVGMIFQSYALYPHMSVFDNVAFPLKLKKINKDRIRKKVKEVAELVGIGELLDRKPGEISGGQQQRTAVARVLAKEPDIFLMDEPLSNVDAKLRTVMRGELKRLQKQFGITTLYVTHDQIEAMVLADKIAVMDRGKILQAGSSDELYNSPKNLFVAGFIGSPPMNLIDCSMNVDKNGKPFLDAGALTLDDSIADVVGEKTSTSEVVLGVRPEDVIVQEKHARKGIEAEVCTVEPFGKEFLVDLKVDDVHIKTFSRTMEKDTGEKVWINFNAKKIHVFDKKTKLLV